MMLASLLLFSGKYRMQRTGRQIDCDKPIFVLNFHSKTDLSQGRTPEIRQLGLLIVEPCASAGKIDAFHVIP